MASNVKWNYMKRYMLIWSRLITKIRYLILRVALPKQQFYIQNNGFHSVFHPIMFEKKEGVFNGTGYTDNNGK